MLKKITAVIFILLVVIACSFPFQILINGPKNNSSVKTGSDSSQINQPTPFLPFIPSITPTPEGHLVSNALVPVNGLHAPSGQVNILILGSDYRPNSGFRTDVMVLISILTKEQKVSIVTFPRDLFVDIPGFGQERINTSQEFGGFPLTKLMFEHDFGVHLDHYIMTNFNGFQSIVDMLGGIDINAASNLTDRCDLPYSHGGYCSVGPGLKHLDGTLALWYVRSRYSSNDFDRGRRVKEVLQGLFNKLMSLNAIARAPELFSMFANNIDTDMNITDILPLIPLAATIAADTGRVRSFSIGPAQVTPYYVPSTGASVLLPNYGAIWQIIQQAVYTS